MNQHFSLFRDLKAFLKSSLKKTVFYGLSSRSIRFRNECAAILLFVWYRILPVRFRKKSCRSERAWFPAHLDAIRLSVLPMAIGLNPPSIFIRKLCPALPFDLLKVFKYLRKLCIRTCC